jgi:hypothetical protein
LNLADPNREIIAVGDIGTHNNMMFNWVAQCCIANPDAMFGIAVIDLLRDVRKSGR